MKIRSILFAIVGILLFPNCSFSQTREFNTGSIPYSTTDTFYLNRTGALRILKMQVDYSYCQQTGKLKDSIIYRAKILQQLSENNISILQTRAANLEAQTRKYRKVILRQRIAGVGIIAVLMLAVLSG